MHIKTKIAAVVICCLLFSLLAEQVYANQAKVSMTIAPGQLSISSPANLSFNSVRVDPSTQTVEMAIPGIAITDLRGTGDGWNSGLQVTHLGIRGESAKKRKISTGNNSTATAADFSVTGLYDGMNASSSFGGEFIITVQAVSPAPSRPTYVLVQKPDGNSQPITLTNTVLSFNGLSVDFGRTQNNYAVGDSFGLMVDYFPYTQAHMQSDTLAGMGTPPSPTNNMSTNAPSMMRGVAVWSNGYSETSAQPNSGIGQYTYTDHIQWSLHPNPLPGMYQAILTYSAQ